MPQTKFCHDYYLILEISQKADIESIRSNYKRLARLKHPDKNLNNPNATAEFQLIQEAYSTLKDPVSRKQYDDQYKPTNHSHGESSHTGSPKNTTAGNDYEKRSAERHKKLQELNEQLRVQERNLFDSNLHLTTLKRDAHRLGTEIDNIVRKQAAKGTVWGYVTSFFVGKPPQADEQKNELDRERLDKMAALKIKESIIERQHATSERYEKYILSIREEIQSIEFVINREKLAEEQRIKTERARAFWQKFEREFEESRKQRSKQAENQKKSENGRTESKRERQKKHGAVIARQ
ncbi:hypothetical protein DTO280E4_4163 [Paecilomyces variotii]|nr:hypothetical protein DTO207G8_8010 [Paecilomyces variotii]KAJ9267377.1 hypothetical protein DTO195F2_610 [Paecilomyces variotii]KAJ9360952.1 hypothetical protein DTO280E4_4163 [Paecilomyces variotii]KAJ9390678.1 hypothetical protein DTO063F5_1628 [Paecilomyces variotii]